MTGSLLDLSLLALLAASTAYCLMAIVAIGVYKRARRNAPPRRTHPISVLRPLAGAEDNTESNLRSVFAQGYPDFEVLLGVHSASDPAAAIARRIMAEFPQVPSRLIVTGEPRVPNAKVWTLTALLEHAREWVVITDSDVSLPENCLRDLVGELSQPGVAAVSCPCRAVGKRVWSRLHALGLNTEFLPGVLVGGCLMRCDFAIGCTLATRRSELNAIGGVESLGSCLAEDFLIGSRMAGTGKLVALSRVIIDHHIGGEDLVSCWRHRMRWMRSTRRSRRAGYVGEIFTRTFTLACVALAFGHGLAVLAAAAIACRLALAYSAAAALPAAAAPRIYWLLLPVEDLLSFFSWIAGFFGNTVEWRGRTLRLDRDGFIIATGNEQPAFVPLSMESAQADD